MSVWKTYIEKFNSGDTDFLQAFDNDTGAFIELIKNKGLLKYLKITPNIDPEYELRIVKGFYESYMPGFIQFIEENLGDVKFENGVFYYVSDPEYLSVLFSESRNTMPIKTIEDVLSGNMNHDWYDDTTDDVYRDVIEELSKKNLEEFYKAVLHYSKDIKINPHTELLESIADEQGHPDFLYIDQQNVNKIIEDKESFDEILDNELPDLKSNLYSLHYSAYNSAYEDRIYNEVWDALDEFFVIDRREWVSVPFYTGTSSNPKVRNVTRIKIPIRNLPLVINEFIDSNIGSTYPDYITYHANFVPILKEVIDFSNDWLRVYAPDYPDSSEVDKNINEMFLDYIYN